MWGYRPDDVHLAAGPLYHAGPSGYANITLYVGRHRRDHGRRGTPREFLRLVEHHRVTTTFLTPAHFIRVLEVPKAERAALRPDQPAPRDPRRRALPDGR